MSEAVKLFVAVKAFIVRDGKVLMLREGGGYADGTNLAKYDVPGGCIEPHESLQAALAREVLEETGCTIASAEAFSAGEWWPKKNGEQWHIVATYFAVKLTDDAVVKLSNDHDDFQWVDIDKPSVALIDTYPPLFQKYNAFLKSF